MSDATPCNFCSLQRFKERATREGKKVFLVQKPLAMWQSGVDVHIAALNERQAEGTWVAWFAELSERCVC